MKRVSLDQLAAEIEATGDLILFTGAGISMLPPAGLPSGPALRNMAVAGICSPPKLRRWKRRLYQNPRFQALVPEVLFQALYDCIGERLHPFFDVLRVARPNVIHELLAEFSTRAGASLVTTNFDLLLESAASQDLPVLHLHGELSQPTQMVVRINQVGRGLSPTTEHELRRLSRGRTICMLGYSGNDTDIFLSLRSAQPRALLWLVRSEEDWAWTNIPRFDSAVAPVSAACGDLLELVHRIAGRPRADSTPATKIRSHAPHGQRSVRGWSRGLSLTDRLACLSAIFTTLTEYHCAAELAEEGLKLAPHPTQATWFRVQATNAFRIIGDFEQAKRYGDEAWSLAGNDPYRAAQAASALGLALLEKDTPEPHQAAEWFERGLALLASGERRASEGGEAEYVIALRGKLYNNLGLAHTFADDVDMGIPAYRRSLRCKSITGDLIGLSQTYVNGSLAYYRGRDYRNAYRWRRRALALIEKYGLSYQLAYLYRRLGTTAASQGRLKQALHHLRKALDVYEQIKAPFDEDLTREAISEVEEMIADHSRSVRSRNPATKSTHVW